MKTLFDSTNGPSSFVCMKFISPLFLVFAIIGTTSAQTCPTHDFDSRPHEVIERIESELTAYSGHGSRSLQCLQTVVHVLWHTPQYNVSDSAIQATINLINQDLRRQNTDTNLTPDYFLPVAVDMEIELSLAQIDPDGQLTSGITHTYTDSSDFHMNYDYMKYDSTGGKSAWNTEEYLNIWLVRNIDNPNNAGVTLSYGVLPGFPESERVGLVCWSNLFNNSNWRVLTHEVGHFLGLLDLSGIDSCSNSDLVDDTPIGLYNTLLADCSDTIVSCNNGPYGDMFMNFMGLGWAWGSCQNMFTAGQKERMESWLATQVPGLLECASVGVTEENVEALQVFPNPTQTQLNFQSFEKGNLSVLDLSGRTVLSSVASKGKNRVEVESLPSGIYLLRLESEQAVSSARFVKN